VPAAPSNACVIVGGGAGCSSLPGRGIAEVLAGAVFAVKVAAAEFVTETDIGRFGACVVEID
jgi:hypothetical protein